MFDPQNKTWCATKVDEEGIAVEGYRGYCPDTCQLDVTGTSNIIVGLIQKVCL
jgi:hypothetical protein